VVLPLLDRVCGFFKQAWVDRFDVLEPDCLVVDYVVLHPHWRGLKLGLFAVRKAVDLLGAGCGLTIVEILPLALEAHDILRVPCSWLPRQDTVKAVLRLRRHYRKMGFERLGRTDFFALPMALRTPTVEELLRPSS
jgi:hypothetical protein